MKKKQKRSSWWQRARALRRLSIAAFSLLLVLLGVAYALSNSGSHETPTVVLRQPEPAPAFSLPTTAGVDFASSDHLGEHNVLLYFNEGMG